MRGATRPNIQRLRKCSTDLKRWLDREKGYKGKPAWSREIGDHGYLHQHGLVGDYGYLDFKKVNDWMIAHGYYELIDGRKVPWRTRYRWLQSREHGAAYMAKYIVKGAETQWPRYTRIRYTPIPKQKFEPDEAFVLIRDVALIKTVEPEPDLSRDMLAPLYHVSPADLLDQGAAKLRKGPWSNIRDTASVTAEHTSPPNCSSAVAGDRILLFSPLSLSNEDVRSRADAGQGAVK
jgi:hypothetical protein